MIEPILQKGHPGLKGWVYFLKQKPPKVNTETQPIPKKIESIIGEVFPEESEILGLNNLGEIISRINEGREVVFEESEKGDHLLFMEIATIIIAATQLTVAIFTYLNSRSDFSNPEPEEVLQISADKAFELLSTDQKELIVTLCLEKLKERG